jgi:hypothetical protein
VPFLYNRFNINIPAEYKVPIFIRIRKGQVKIGEFIKFEFIDLTKSSCSQVANSFKSGILNINIRPV